MTYVSPARASAAVSKIAQVTAAFWALKILATTLGETSGDFLAQTLGLGFVEGLAITGAILAVLLALQLAARTFHPAIFWAAITGTTMAGTEISDLMDRTLGLGYNIAYPVVDFLHRSKGNGLWPSYQSDSEKRFLDTLGLRYSPRP
ncbi:MAG: hypothetical protein EBU97_04025 [Rhodobacteraceae bacterium]|nr:hypothetical protein [Paracoccaceae bacterium]